MRFVAHHPMWAPTGRPIGAAPDVRAQKARQAQVLKLCPRGRELESSSCPAALSTSPLLPCGRVTSAVANGGRWRAGRSVRLLGPASARRGPAAPRAPARASQSAGRRHGRQSRAFKWAAIFGLRCSVVLGRFGPRDALSRVSTSSLVSHTKFGVRNRPPRGTMASGLQRAAETGGVAHGRGAARAAGAVRRAGADAAGLVACPGAVTPLSPTRRPLAVEADRGGRARSTL